MVRVWVDGWAGGRGLTCPPTFAQPPPTHAHPPTHPPIVQLGGMVLHGGQVAEMRTGEGKTLVATLPAYLNALEGGSPPPLAAALSLPARPPCTRPPPPPHPNPHTQGGQGVFIPGSERGGGDLALLGAPARRRLCLRHHLHHRRVPLLSFLFSSPCPVPLASFACVITYINVRRETAPPCTLSVCLLA